jgi:Transcriptional regulators
MKREKRELSREVEQPDYAHERVREVLLEIGGRRSASDAKACGELFAQIENALAIRRHLVRPLTERGVSEAKFCALTVLVGAAPKPSTPSDLAHHAGVTRAAMTDVLDQMVESGWVTRVRSEADRRQWVVRLTPEGRAVADGAIDALMKAAREWVGRGTKRKER